MPPRYTFFGQQKAGYRKPTLARCEKKLLIHAHFRFFFERGVNFYSEPLLLEYPITLSFALGCLTANFSTSSSSLIIFDFSLAEQATKLVP